MKFLTFNILVGGALAWLLFDVGLPTSLLSILPGSAPVQQVSTDCRALPSPTSTQARIAETNPDTSTAKSNPIETASVVQREAPKQETRGAARPLPTEGEQIVSVGAPGGKASKIDSPRTSLGTGPARDAATSPSDGLVVKVPVGRRDALLSLAENMELFSLERVVK
jgi:hypothetical protein